MYNQIVNTELAPKSFLINWSFFPPTSLGLATYKMNIKFEIYIYYTTYNIVVIIRANKGTPPLNEDSVLFREDRVCLGKVNFDIYISFAHSQVNLASIICQGGENIYMCEHKKNFLLFWVTNIKMQR